MGWPKLLRDAIGMKVRTRVPLTNGFVKIPAGTEGTIIGGPAWSALKFQAQPCVCCGVQPWITRVDKYAFEPIEEGADATASAD